MEETTLDPAKLAPRGPVRGVSSGGSPCQKVKTDQVLNWSQTRYGVYMKSVTEMKETFGCTAMVERKRTNTNKTDHNYITD